jgi:hypothetical protein
MEAKGGEDQAPAPNAEEVREPWSCFELWEPMEGVVGVDDLCRCDRGSRLNPAQQIPLGGLGGGFRVLTARSNQVDGRVD